MNKYYVYFHINPYTKEVFYVGKGCGRRANSRHIRNRYWNFYVAKYGFEVSIVETGLTQDDACLREIYWISQLGRKDLKKGKLLNMTDGGDGNNNFSEKTRKALSDKGKLRPSPRKGVTLSQDEKLRISETLKRKYNSGEFKPNISGLNTPESRLKISEAKKGKSTWNKGKTNIYSDNVKSKISEGLKKYYEEISPIHLRKEKRKKQNRKYLEQAKERKKLLPKKTRKKRILTQEHKDKIGQANRLNFLNKQNNLQLT